MSQAPKQQNPKSSLLWNVVDPDDPYDIRKSMIARLPDHHQNFMGGNIEIVCLMQAAQIERLNTYLAEFQLRYRELDRQKLDRHLFEIQIKQLSERANEMSKFKTENVKLVEYIKKLTIQLQEMSRRPNVSESLQTEHEQLFKRYQALLVQLQNSRETINAQTVSLNKSLEDNKELRIKLDKLDKQRMTELTQEREKYELKIRERIEIEIKEVDQRWSVKIYQLESDCRLYREQIESKNHQISSLMVRNQSLRRQIENKEKNTFNSQLYQEKVQQLEQINKNLVKKASQLEHIFQQYTKMEIQLRDVQKSLQESQQRNKRYNSQIDRLTRLINESSKDSSKMIQLENKVALFSQEIQRLTYQLDSKTRDYSIIQSKYNSSKIEFDARIRQITSEYESRIATSKTQIESLEMEIKPLRSMTMELKLKNELLIKENSAVDKNSKIIVDLENQIKRCNSKILEQNNIITSLNQAERLLGESDKEINRLKKQLNDLRRSNQQYETDLKKGNLITFATMDVEIRKSVQQVRRKIQIESQRQIQKIIQDKTRLQRANSQLAHEKRMLQQEMGLLREKLDRKNVQLEQNMSSIETRYTHQIHDITISLRSVREENQRLHNEKNRLKASLDDLEKQRLGFKDSIRKLQQYRILIEDLRRQNTNLKQETSQTQQSLFRTQRQTEQRFIKIYTSQLQDKDNIISSLERQIKSAREELKSFQASNESQKANFKNYRDRLLMVSQQMERLNEVLTNKNKQIESLKAQLGTIELAFRKQLGDKDEEIKRVRVQVQNAEGGMRKQIQERDEEIRRLRVQVDGWETEKRRYASQRQESIRVLRTQIETLEITHRKQIIQRQTQLKTLRVQIESGDPTLKKQIADKDTHITNLKGQLQNINIVLQKLKEEKQRERSQYLGQISLLEQGQEKRWKEREGDIRREYEQRITRITQEKQSIQIRITNEYETKIRTIIENERRGSSGQLQSLQKVNEALRTQLATLKNECNSLRTQISTQQQQLHKNKIMLEQLEGISAQMASDRDNYMKICNELQVEVQKLRNAGKDRESSQMALMEIRSKYTEISAICVQYQQQIKAYEAKIENYDRQAGEHDRAVKSLGAQVQRLTNVAEDKNRQIQGLRTQLQNLRAVSQDRQRLAHMLQEKDSQIFRLNKNLQTLHLQLQSHKISLSQVTLQLQSFHSASKSSQLLSQKCQQYEIQIKNLKQMLQQLQEISAHTVAERDQLFELSHRYKAEIEELNGRIREWKGKMVEEGVFLQIQTAYNALNVSYGESKNTIEVLNRKVQEYELKLRQQSAEIDRLGLVLKQRESSFGIVDQLKQRISWLEVEYSNKTEQAKEWQQKYIQLYQAYKTESETSKAKVLEYQKRMAGLDQQFEQLNGLIRALRQQNQELKIKITEFNDLIEKNRFLSAQIDRLNTLVISLKKDLSDTRLLLTDQMALQKRIQQYMALLVILFAQIETLRNRVSQTETECQNVRRSSLTPHRIDRQVGRSMPK